uniref:CBS domain-containing protein n=1 Tax=Corynebacterium glutamicum TaxID=1718 RepID=UPI00095B1F61|nr:CBS domain-containing protein [Corynebacterium glutamicum]
MGTQHLTDKLGRLLVTMHEQAPWVQQHSHVLAGEVLATPRRDAVIALEEIAQKVQNPPQIRAYMIKSPDVVAPTDSLAKAAELVIEKGYSQLPV